MKLLNRPPHPLVWALMCATVAAYAVWANQPRAFEHAVAGAGLIFAGLGAWTRRPDNATGRLLAFGGAVWLLPDVAQQSTTVTTAVAAVASGLFVVVLGHVLIAFPSGTAAGRLERASIAFGYTAVLGANILSLLTFSPCRFVLDPVAACADPPLAVFASRRLAEAAGRASSAALIAVVVLAIVAAGARWRASSLPGRRQIEPALVTATAVGAAVVAWRSTLLAGSAPAANYAESVLPYGVAIVPAAFLAAFIRSRLSRAGVGDLLFALREPMPPGGLRAAIARALGDPSIEILYWLPEHGVYVGSDGLPTDPEAGGRALTVIEHDGKRLAALVHDPALRHEPDRVRAVGAAAELALHNERLQAEVRAQLEEVRASRARIVEAADASRQRVERDLHDGAQQRLVALSLALRLARKEAGESPSPALGRLLDEASRELEHAIRELRELVRGIHPAVLTEEGLDAALRDLAERAPIPAKLIHTTDRRLPAQVEAAAYFVASEALTNTAKYAEAGEVTIEASMTGDVLRLVVADDGRGGADMRRGSGLRGLADRVAAVDGRLVVDSPAGRGTRIIAEIPCG